MSAHHIAGMFRGQAVNFVIGWEREKKSYFFEIVALSEQVLYRSEESANLKHYQGRIESMFDLTAELARLRVELPQLMLMEVGQDRLNNIGNRFAFYDERGRITLDTVCSEGWQRTVPGSLAHGSGKVATARTPGL